MNARAKVILVGVAALALGIWFLPRLVRRIDSTVDHRWEKAGALEAQYRDMTNAYRMAGELLPDHPTRKLWEERRAVLVEAGYIETREFQLKPLTAKGASRAFFTAFHARFPGVECSVRAAKSDVPVLVVTARKSDLSLFGDIKSFASGYEPEK